MLNFPFLSLRQMSSLFDEEAVTLGRWLTIAGLRERENRTGEMIPSARAHQLGLVKKVKVNGSEFYAWRNPQTVELLVAAGHPLASDSVTFKGTPPIAEATTFSYRRETETGNTFVISSQDDMFYGVVAGQTNAARITKTLNHLAQRGLVKSEQGGLGVDITLGSM